MSFFRKSSIVFILIMTVFGHSSCVKNNQGIIPYVPVDKYVFISNPSNMALNVDGGWIYLEEGSRGIVLYRLMQGEFLAFDRHCTYQPYNPCGKVSIDSSNIMLTDTCCGSQFLLTDGSVLKGPAQYPLLRYQTHLEGNQLHIYN